MCRAVDSEDKGRCFNTNSYMAYDHNTKFKHIPWIPPLPTPHFTRNQKATPLLYDRWFLKFSVFIMMQTSINVTNTIFNNIHVHKAFNYDMTTQGQAVAKTLDLIWTI